MDTAQIKDWHAHVYFDPATRDQAWALRERIEKSFDIQMGRFHEKPVGPHPMFSYQVTVKNDQLGAADLVADAEPRRPHRLHPSQHRPGSRRPSRPRGVDRQVGAAGARHLHQEEGLTHGFASAAGQEGRRETEGAQGDGRRVRIVDRRPDLGRAARGARRLGLLHGRRRGLYAAGRRGLPDRDARKSAPASAPPPSRGRRSPPNSCASG